MKSLTVYSSYQMCWHAFTTASGVRCHKSHNRRITLQPNTSCGNANSRSTIATITITTTTTTTTTPTTPSNSSCLLVVVVVVVVVVADARGESLWSELCV